MVKCANCGKELTEDRAEMTYEAGVGAVLWHKSDECEAGGGTVFAPENDEYEKGDRFI